MSVKCLLLAVVHGHLEYITNTITFTRTETWATGHCWLKQHKNSCHYILYHFYSLLLNIPHTVSSFTDVLMRIRDIVLSDISSLISFNNAYFIVYIFKNHIRWNIGSNHWLWQMHFFLTVFFFSTWGVQSTVYCDFTVMWRLLAFFCDHSVWPITF